MEIMVLGLFVVGVALAIIGAVWFLLGAFSEGILWGLAVMFIPFVSVIFLIVHWQRARWPFLLYLFGSALVIGVLVFAPELVPGLGTKLPVPQ